MGNSKQLFYTSIEFSVASLYYTTIFIDYVQGHLIFLVVTLFYRRELFASLGSISFDKKYSTFIDPIGMYCCRFIFHNKWASVILPAFKTNNTTINEHNNNKQCEQVHIFFIAFPVYELCADDTEFNSDVKVHIGFGTEEQYSIMGWHWLLDVARFKT